VLDATGVVTGVDSESGGSGIGEGCEGKEIRLETDGEEEAKDDNGDKIGRVGTWLVAVVAVVAAAAATAPTLDGAV